jgi:hypothetical protein
MIATRRLIYWIPRVLGFALTAFLSLFALDVFGERRSISATAVALVMHLRPALLVALVLALAWRHETFGAIAFVLLGFLYIVWRSGHLHWPAYAGIAGPLFLIGGLFLANSILKRRTGSSDSAAAPGTEP